MGARGSKVSLLFGGVSFEHEISIVSAISVKKVLGDAISHFLFLDGAHKLYLIPPELMQAKTFATGEYSSCKQVEWIFGGVGIRGLLGGLKPIANLGVLLSVIHGGDGEDGVVSSLLDFYKIPYIAPRPAACALSFSKILTKMYAAHIGVKTLPYECFSLGDAIRPSFSYPFIIKPARLGSSIGVSVVAQESELEYALDSAFSYDREIVIEPFYRGVEEFNLAGYKNAQGEIVFSLVEEPKKSALLSFEDKYLDFSRTTQASAAAIPVELESRLQEAFAKVYGSLFEGALIRCDFFLIDGEVYLNEINPIPGSLAHYLFSDFASHIASLQAALPRSKPIPITYNYVQQIRAAKGK